MAMNERSDSAVDSEARVSFSDAARFLGLDLFTFYALVQREEIAAVFAASGEFVVLQTDLDRLGGKEPPC